MRNWSLSRSWAVLGPLVGFLLGSLRSSEIPSVLKGVTQSIQQTPTVRSVEGATSKESEQESSPTTDAHKPLFDLLPHLADCEKPQSSRSLSEMAADYKPSKFYRYRHTNFDRFYPAYMEAYRLKQFRMLEIGLDTGKGSLLWAEYFPCAKLVGLEYNEGNAHNEGASSIQTIVGDQGNATFLKTEFLRQTGGPFDLIVDDGGHHYEQQRASYEILFEKALNPGGLYVLEDIETSYWAKGTKLYGKPITRGGQSDPTAIVRRFQKVVDVVNKKFHDNTYTVFGQVDQLIAEISFASNVIFMTKKTKDHCWNERPYVWPNRLALDAPARNQPVHANQGSLIHTFCKEYGIDTQVRAERKD